MANLKMSPTGISTPRDSKFRLPTYAQPMEVTQEMARDWLANRNTQLKNRSLAPAMVLKYAGAMRRGEWDLIHQGIAFDTDGWVLDGQHRLAAVALSGVTCKFWVFPDTPRDTFDKLDAGRKRQAGQLLHVPNRNVLASTVRVLAVADGADPRYMDGAFAELSTPQIMSAVRHYGADLEHAARMAMGVKNKTTIPPSPHAAVLYQALHSPHSHLVPDWIEALSYGADISKTDPRLKLRTAFMAPAATRAAAMRTSSHPYALIVKAWNAYVTHKPVQQLAWKDAESMPKVIGYTKVPKES